MFKNAVSFRSSANAPLLSELFFTFSSHMNEALYGRFGYYSEGTPFSNSNHYDFSTHATKGQGMGFVIAAYIEQVYSEQRKNSNNRKPFSIVELSGGDGSLAFSILSIIENLTDKNYRNFKSLWEDLKYSTYEISPVLTAQQNRKNSKWVDSKKYTVINKSAEDMPTNEQIDFLFSNEFWDALALDAIQKQKDGAIEIGLCLPYISSDQYDALDKTIRDENESHIRMLESKINNKSKRIQGKQLISMPMFNALNTHHEFSEKVEWETMMINLDHFPELKSVFSKAQVYLDELNPEKMNYVSPLAINIMDMHAKMNPYFTLHFDYAAAYKGGNRGMVRAYPSDSETHAYDFQPHVDITLEADFRLLALMISNRQLQHCVHGMNAQAMNNTTLMMEQFKALGNLDFEQHIEKFALTMANYKFLACSSSFDPRSLMGPSYNFESEFSDDFPDHPIRKTNNGIPFDRPYKHQPEFPQLPLIPNEDLRNLYVTLERLKNELDSAVEYVKKKDTVTEKNKKSSIKI